MHLFAHAYARAYARKHAGSFHILTNTVWWGVLLDLMLYRLVLVQTFILFESLWWYTCAWLVCKHKSHVLCHEHAAEEWGHIALCPWGSRFATLTLCVPEQESRWQSDHGAACGRVPGPYVAAAPVSSCMWVNAYYAFWILSLTHRETSKIMRHVCMNILLPEGSMWVHVRLCTYMHLCMYVCVYARYRLASVYICVWVYIYIYICMYIYIYIYM